MKLTFLWRSRLSCSLSFRANVGVLPLMYKFISSSFARMWRVIKLMEGCVKLPSSWPEKVTTEAPLETAPELYPPRDILPKHWSQRKPPNASGSLMLKHLCGVLVFEGIFDADDSRRLIGYRTMTLDYLPQQTLKKVWNRVLGLFLIIKVIKCCFHWVVFFRVSGGGWRQSILSRYLRSATIPRVTLWNY